jgi:hypothetical protein
MQLPPLTQLWLPAPLVRSRDATGGGSIMDKMNR